MVSATLYTFGLILLMLALIDEFILFLAKSNGRNPIRRFSHNALAIAAGGFLIWLS